MLFEGWGNWLYNIQYSRQATDVCYPKIYLGLLLAESCFGYALARMPSFRNPKIIKVYVFIL